MTAWTDPAWRAEAERWIRGRAEELGRSLTGPIAQPHIQPWATVMRAPTADGDLWFKATLPVMAHEAGVVRVLAARRPDLVPPLLAGDPDRGWMLMDDAGERLRAIVERERDLGRWEQILPLYGELQADAAADAGRLAALGAPARPLALLRGQYDSLLARADWLADDERDRLRGLSPRVAELCAQLAASGIPDSIQHDDLHDGQVFVRDGRYLFMDWGDACVSHPFFTMSVTLEGVLGWGLDDIEGSQDITPFADAYLRPFERYAGAAALREALAVALRLGWICRALNTEMCISSYGIDHQPAERDRAAVHLRMFADGLSPS